jgi:predicted acetyltransferase
VGCERLAASRGRARTVDNVVVITLPEVPRLVWPVPTVRTSYLVGEQADCLLRGTDTEWLAPASENFDDFVNVRRGVKERWAVPTTMFWYVSGEYYLGTLVIRHQLNGELAEEAGGHVGYHVVAPWRRQGHATRMLAAALDECRAIGLQRILLCCAPDNEASRRVIVTNGGRPDGQRHGEDRYWIELG